ncbi:PUL domain protein [Gregarina niphandrodes]|uniref:PUL domain protein n=1 Tax=Gregarina niphandrodes TaxID=110365 RepID=A0A023AXN9_GRENI|nr:PUL domain protein [Gregarina niphandrodes]EZG43417.1 PUL domain protein [Gregarina niphandrodes]|eukprot:XP_011133358.1 PUL domain protein [Gregarina niphandrodes]
MVPQRTWRIDNKSVYSVSVRDAHEVLVGNGGGVVYVIDPLMNEFRWDSRVAGQAVCSIASKDDWYYFGSWDGALYAYHSSSGKCVPQWKLIDKLKHGVCVCILPPYEGTLPPYKGTLPISGEQVFPAQDLLCVGSQNGTLLLVDGKTGQIRCVKENAHEDIIRKIRMVANHPVAKLVLTCSNDGTFGVWDGYTLECYGKYQASSTMSFCFDVQGWYEDGVINVVCAMDDGLVKHHCVQIGQELEVGSCKNEQSPLVELGGTTVWRHNNTIWSLALDVESMDVYAGTDDGHILVFNSKAERSNVKELLSESVVAAKWEEVRQLVEENDRQKQAQVALDLNNIPKAQDRARHPGKKVGQTSLFTDDQSQQVMVYQWSGTEWICIGEMLGQTQQASTVIQSNNIFEGDEFFPAGIYDHIFDVEIDTRCGDKPRLPYNNGQAPRDVAERFCTRENIPKTNIPDIVKFIQENAIVAKPQESPKTPAAEEVCVKYTHFKFDKPSKWQAAFKKLREIDAQEKEKMSQSEYDLLSLVETSVSKSSFFREDLRSSEIHVLFDVQEATFIKWSDYLPVLDLWRYYVLHENVINYLRKNGRGSLQISFLVSTVANKFCEDGPGGSMAMMATRCLANLATIPNIREFMLRNFEVVFQDLKKIAPVTDDRLSTALCMLLHNLVLSANMDFRASGPNGTSEYKPITQSIQNLANQLCLPPSPAKDTLDQILSTATQ